MKTEKQLIEEGLISQGKETPRSYIAKFYRQQLVKFEKIGIGNETENKVKITQKLIDTTKKRLRELQPMSLKEFKRLEKEFYTKEVV